VTAFLIAQADVVGADPQFMPSLGRMFLALGVVLSVLLALGWLMRKGVIRRRSSGALSIETALPLGDRRSLVIVAVEGRRLLLGLAPSQVGLVAELKPGGAASFDPSLAHATQRSQSA
jgi:flagellar protein FliO/FliZ